MRQAGRKAHKLARRATDKKSFLTGGPEKNSSKLNDQSGNLYEYKAPLWKTQGKARMYLKTKELSRKKPGCY
jgi:hypothetical protein